MRVERARGLYKFKEIMYMNKIMGGKHTALTGNKREN